ncbi:MAG TPA: M20/M25/M40 family metallo-hydrolase [Terriglobales bacterium]|jgi:acetylornithine deacetylase/succinyl-diaminopimelate desuccinylase-like protein|nr:M20/M25/M40 family metallo-hydrolase [Terriglobales bacterium]
MALSASIGAQTAVQQEVARLAGLREVHATMEWFRSHEPELRDWQLEVAAIPAPPFGEGPRAEWLRARFCELGLEDVQVDAVGNVVGVRPPADPGQKLVAVTAHIDTVFAAGTPLNVRREGDRLYGPGISDNGAGIVGLLALASALRAAKARLSAGLLFIGNVGEEGEGDLRGMRHIFCESFWKDRIGPTVVLDGAAIDTVVTQALGSRRFQVTIHGPGGHSWSDFGAPNPIVVLSRAIARFSRTELPDEPKISANVGVISGGTSVNSIPESASMRVDIRSASQQEMERVERALREAVAGVASEYPRRARNGSKGISYEIQLIGCRPAAELDPNARILHVIHAVDAHLGNRARPHRASTDANIPLSLGREAISIGAGGTGGGAHTLQEWYDPAERDLGLKRALLAVLALAGVK